jgi:hypothetical protein
MVIDLYYLGTSTQAFRHKGISLFLINSVKQTSREQTLNPPSSFHLVPHFEKFWGGVVLYSVNPECNFVGIFMKHFIFQLLPVWTFPSSWGRISVQWDGDGDEPHVSSLHIKNIHFLSKSLLGECDITKSPDQKRHNISFLVSSYTWKQFGVFFLCYLAVKKTWS